MYQNQQTQTQIQQQEQHQQTTRRPMSLSPESLLRGLSYLIRRKQKRNRRDQKDRHSHHRGQHHRQKHKAACYLPHCGLVVLIFLSVIKDSLTTTLSTSYFLSLDITTMVPQANFLPYFDFDVPRNITVTVGQTGFLHCRVESLGDKDVSWIRKRDLHILTAGSTTYTSDQRFQVLRPENSGNWTLQIKYPQPRDSGIYECQINTEPKMSLSYTFNVVELKATITGPTDLYVKSGSDINLTCRIIQGPHELGNIFWYKGSEIVDMTTNQNEIDSGTRITVESDWSDGLTSRLKIRRASPSDTGNYTCVPTIAKSSSVYVHVIIGEHPAAMQHNASNTHCCSFYISLCCMLFTILTCILQQFMCACTPTIATTLTTKGPSTSLSSSSMADANETTKHTSLSLSTSTSTLTSTSKTTIHNIPAVSKIAQSKPFALSLTSSTKTKVFPSSALLYSYTSTTTALAAISTTCNRTRPLVINGRIPR